MYRIICLSLGPLGPGPGMMYSLYSLLRSLGRGHFHIFFSVIEADVAIFGVCCKNNAV